MGEGMLALNEMNFIEPSVLALADEPGATQVNL